jgi:hypothetical protein
MFRFVVGHAVIRGQGLELGADGRFTCPFATGEEDYRAEAAMLLYRVYKNTVPSSGLSAARQ